MLDHNSEPESSEDSFLGSDDQALSISKPGHLLLGDMDDQEIMSSLAISDGEPDQECADEQSTDMSHDQIIFEDDSCNSFYGHNNNPIYALAVLKSHVISGGGDDRCFCWDPSADPPAPIYPKAFSKRMPQFIDYSKIYGFHFGRGNQPRCRVMCRWLSFRASCRVEGLVKRRLATWLV